MSFVTADAAGVAAAAGQLSGIGSSLKQAAEAAAAPTTGIPAAAADEISTAVSRLFGTFGQDFQAVNAQAAVFQAEFVKALNGGSAAYADAERAAQQALAGFGFSGGPSAAPLDPILGPILGGGGGGGGTTPSNPLGGLLGGLTGGGGGTPANPLAGLLGGLTGGGGTGGLGALLNPAALTPVLNGVGGVVGNLGTTLTNLGNSLQNLLFPQAASNDVGPYQNPYQRLYENTNRNLVAIGDNYRPFPVLNQIGINQGHYASIAARDFATFMQGFPGNVPPNIVNFINSGNPANLTAGLQQFANGTSGFYGILGHQLQEVGAGLQQTFPTFQRDLDLAGIAINQGRYEDAVEYGARSFIDLFITGFDTSGLEITPANMPLVGFKIAGPIGLEGPAGALMPILTALGDQATGTASTFPTNSWAGATMRDLAAGIGVLTDGGVSADFLFGLNLNPSDPGAELAGEAVFGLPLQLGFAFLGAPFAAFGGLAEGSTAFGTAVVNGNILGAANAIGNMPAYILDGALNGEVIVQQSLPVTVDLPVLGIPITLPTDVGLPMAGLLVDPHPISATVPLSQIISLPPGLKLPDLVVPLGGTKFGGLVPMLLNTMPQDVATAMSYQNGTY